MQILHFLFRHRRVTSFSRLYRNSFLSISSRTKNLVYKIRPDQWLIFPIKFCHILVFFYSNFDNKQLHDFKTYLPQNYISHRIIIAAVPHSTVYLENVHLVVLIVVIAEGRKRKCLKTPHSPFRLFGCFHSIYFPCHVFYAHSMYQRLRHVHCNMPLFHACWTLHCVSNTWHWKWEKMFWLNSACFSVDLKSFPRIPIYFFCSHTGQQLF